jgi:hypothetical protein
MTNAPAGWYPDPENASQSRWWDGTAWTDHRSAPAPTTPYSTQVADLKAPEGTPWNTVWIWIIVILPLVPMIGLLTVDWGGLIDIHDRTGLSSLALFASPGYLLSMFGGWVVYGLCVWFAYLDWRELQRRDVPRPFHWAWAFLSSIVYVIGRSVVVRRRTGHGISPMWAAIASIVVSIGAAVYIMIEVMASVFAAVGTISR